MATTIFNIPRCAIAGNFNSGVPKCFLDIKKIVMFILADNDFKIPAASAADLATAKAYLQAQALLGNIHPIPNLVMNSDNSEDVTKSTDAYGNIEVTKDGAYNINMFVKKGGACYNAILRSFNGSGKNVFLVDSDMNLLGTAIGADMRAASAIFYTPKFKFANGSDPTRYSVDLTLTNPEELNDAGKLRYIAGEDSNGISIDYPNEIVGNLDLLMSVVTNTDSALTVKLNLMCGNSDFYDLFADEMAAVGAWIITKSGAAVTPTGVTKDATNKGWIIAHGEAGACKVKTARATALAALSVGGGGENGYESDTIDVTLVHV